MKIYRIILLAFLVATNSVLAWDRGTVAYNDGDRVSIEPIFGPDSIHTVDYSAAGPELEISFTNLRDYHLRDLSIYVGITDYFGKGVAEYFTHLDIPAGDKAEIIHNFADIAENPGYYDVRVQTYDNGREAGYDEFTFAYNVENMEIPEPVDLGFAKFWKTTLDSLNKTPLDPVVTLIEDKCTDEVDAYKVNYVSLHGVRVYGWYTVPKNLDKPAPALILLPGYATSRLTPGIGLSKQGYAVLRVQVRGYDVDQESYPKDNGSYATIGIDSPETYIYREIVCHCIRGVDFLASRKGEVDNKRIGAMGGSQGGGLSIMLAGLDKRIKFVAANVPFMSNWPLAMKVTGNPTREIVWYINKHSEKKDRVMRTVSFFDTMNVAAGIDIPVILSAGYWDRTCPVNTIYGLYRKLGTKDKKLCVYPYLDHPEVGHQFGTEQNSWLKKYFPSDK